MKNAIVVSILLLAYFSTSCQKESYTDVIGAEQRLQAVAKSDLYRKYMEISDHRLYLVTIKAYDSEDIGRIFNQHPEKLNISDFDRSLFKEVRGGYLYYDVALENELILSELNKKFNYRQFSLEQRKQISKLYHERTNYAGRETLKEKVINYYSKKQ
jgi:PBP1b-binding outer membrane lipoprotein LpoB